MDYATDMMDLLRTDINEQMERRTKALQAAGDIEELRQPGEIESLMGQASHLWERKEESKKEIAMLEARRQELESQWAQASPRGCNCVIKLGS